MDSSILKSFFMYTFEDEFKIFLEKYNLEPRELGPWIDLNNEVASALDKLKLPSRSERGKMSESEK